MSITGVDGPSSTGAAAGSLSAPRRRLAHGTPPPRPPRPPPRPASGAAVPLVSPSMVAPTLFGARLPRRGSTGLRFYGFFKALFTSALAAALLSCQRSPRPMTNVRAKTCDDVISTPRGWSSSATMAAAAGVRAGAGASVTAAVALLAGRRAVLLARSYSSVSLRARPSAMTHVSVRPACGGWRTQRGLSLAAWQRESAEAAAAVAPATPALDADGRAAAARTAQIRNVAIIAHVDHGKTTLVDKLLQACNETLTGERVMDSNALESERGITILAKCTSARYRDYDINIVDTPGHADFGGEVERILGMVDSVVLLVDATEGPMTQTKFVLNKALRNSLRPLVVLNKVDRDSARLGQVENEIFDLFALLGATDEQLDFPILYASAREGWAVRDLKTEPRTSMRPLLDAIVEHVPPPTLRSAAEAAPFSMAVTMIQRDAWLGRMVTGRIASGTVRVGDAVHGLSAAGTELESGRVTKIVKRRGLARLELPDAVAGDIVTLAGLGKVSVTDTIAAPAVVVPLPAVPVDPPTVSMTFSVNDSPLAGKVGTKLTSQQIAERLYQEMETNVSLRVLESADRKEALEVQGRGEMQLGVLIETMRREGFELSVSPPTVVYRTDEKGNKLEPVEELTIEVDEQYAGIVIEKVQRTRWQAARGQTGGMILTSSGRHTCSTIAISSSRCAAASLSTWRRSSAAKQSCSSWCRRAR